MMRFLITFWLAIAGVTLPLAFTPPQQPDPLTTDQELLTTDQELLTRVAGLETQDAEQAAELQMLWGTLDSYAISTQVATLVNTPIPTITPRPTSSPTATATRTPQPMPPTPTPAAVEPTPTAEDINTPPDGIVLESYDNAGIAAINRRACAGLDCPVVDTLPRYGSLWLCPGETVRDGYRWKQIARAEGETHQWIAVQNVSTGQFLMFASGTTQVSRDVECGG